VEALRQAVTALDRAIENVPAKEDGAVSRCVASSYPVRQAACSTSLEVGSVWYRESSVGSLSPECRPDSYVFPSDTRKHRG